MEKRYDVFISYSTQDQKVVESIRNFLEREGYRCFVAYRDIPRGVVWATAITDAIDTSAMMLVVFSNAFNGSPQTDREIELASENRIPILTFRVDNVPMTGAKKYYLKNLNWIDAFPNPENYFGNLLDSVVRLIGPSSIVVDHAAEEEAERLAREEAERKAREAAERRRQALVGVPSSDSPHGGNPPISAVSEGRRTPQPVEPTDSPHTEPPHSGPKTPKNKKPLWITLGAVALALLLLLLLWPNKEEPVLPTDADTEAYQACETVEDYRNYISVYGEDALHYAEAMDFIERYVADSLQQDSLSRAHEQEEQPQTSQNTPTGGNETIAGGNDGSNASNGNGSATGSGNSSSSISSRGGSTGRDSGNGNVSVSGSANGHDYVDLGLPSGTLWATCNVGASEPEDYGNYFAWGETELKTTYNWDNYKYVNKNGNNYKLTKYCSRSGYGNDGFTDNLTILNSKDDPASVNWGGGWRTPTKAQWDELRQNTTNRWTVQNGIKGLLFVGKNKHSIFLPASGYRSHNDLCFSGFYGRYWSRSLYSDYQDNAWNLYFYSEECHMDYCYRYQGFSVRPIRMKSSPTTGGSESPSIAGNTPTSDNNGVAGVDNGSSASNGNGGISGGSSGNGTTTGTANGHEWVDLGLPSGTLWATCNVGASKPEEYGSYFAWGETSTKESYTWENYKYANGKSRKHNDYVSWEIPILTKYCSSSDYGNNGFTDNLTSLQGSDDPATVNWGSGWHTPTKTQWDELRDNTTDIRTTRNGKAGRLFKSKKNGQTIFLPIAGCRIGNALPSPQGEGYYWTRELRTNEPEYALCFDFCSEYLYKNCHERPRYNGLPVRPVREK